MAKQQAKQQTKQARGDHPGNERQPQSSGSSGARTESEGDAEDDHIYGLASVLYHALQGVTAARKYKEDAQRAGEEELVQFFEECRLEGTARAKQAKSLLVAFSEESDEDEDDDEDDEDEDEDT